MNIQESDTGSGELLVLFYLKEDISGEASTHFPVLYIHLTFIEKSHGFSFIFIFGGSLSLSNTVCN
jgi:hypothetical protein